MGPFSKNLLKILIFVEIINYLRASAKKKKEKKEILESNFLHADYAAKHRRRLHPNLRWTFYPDVKLSQIQGEKNQSLPKSARSFQRIGSEE